MTVHLFVYSAVHVNSSYCKTCYFCFVLILRFWIVEILLHFSFAFSYFPSILLMYSGPLMGQTELLQMFNFVMLTCLLKAFKNSMVCNTREQLNARLSSYCHGLVIQDVVLHGHAACKTFCFSTSDLGTKQSSMELLLKNRLGEMEVERNAESCCF